MVDKVLPLTLGVSASGTIATPAEQDRFTFSGAVGQRLVFDGQGDDAISLNVTLTAPSGATLFVVAHGSDTAPVYLVETGTYTLAFDGNGDATGAYSFRMLDKAAAADLTLGTTASGQLSPSSEMDLYKFTGTAGQRVNLESISASGTDATWQLVGPANQVLGAANISGNIGEVFLPASGVYGVLVQGATFGGAALDYQLRLSAVSSPSGATTGFGTPHSGTINPGETQDFAYTAPAGTVVFFDSLDNTGISLVADLKDPSEAVVLTIGVTADFAFYQFQQSGTHKLTLRGADAGSSGTFNFRLLNLADANALTLGAVVPSMTLPALQTDLYRFTGSAGQRLFYDALDRDVESLWVRLYSPLLGELVLSDSETDWGPLFLPEPGTFVVTLENTQAAPVDYSFRLIDTANNPASAIAFDTDTRANLSNPGYKTKVYRFDGVAGQRLYFQSLGTDPDASWFLYTPQNGGLAATSITADFELVLPQTGEYLLVVGGQTEEEVPVLIRIITANATTTPLTFDTVITGELTEAGEEHRFTFLGAAGQRLFYDGRDNDFDTINARLLQPDGSIFPSFNVNSDGDFGPFTLTQAGEYSLILGGSTEVTANYSFNVRSTVPTAGKDTPITGSLDPTTEADLFRFAGDAGERLFFDSRNPLAGGSWSLYGPNNFLLAETVLAADFSMLLPQTGAYTLVLTTAAADPVNYDFTIVTPDTTTSSSVYGGTQSGTLDEPGERFVFTFAGDYGRRIYYDALDGNSDDLQVELRAPSGAIVFNGNADSDFGPFTQTEEGTYRLIFGGTSDTLGDFRATLQTLATAGTFVGAGATQTASGTLDPGNEAAFQRFAGTAGQRVLLESLSASDPDATWRLVGLQDQNLAGPVPIESDLPEVVLPASGDYFVLIEGNAANADPVTYSLRKTVTNPTGTITGFGTTNEGTIDPGEEETFEFTVPAGQWIYFDSLENNADSVNVEIRDPDDTVLAVFGTTSDFGPLFTTKSDAYKVVVKGTDGSSTGDFKFRLLDLASNSTALTAGTSTTTTLDEPFETVIYRFDAVAGVRGIYDALSASGGGSAAITLFGPSGVVLSGCAFAFCEVFADTGPVTLPDSGTYYLLFSSLQAETFSFDFRFIDSSKAPAETMPVGATRTATLDPGLQLQVYRVPLAGRQRLYCDGQGTDPNASWSLYGQNNEFLGGAGVTADFEIDVAQPLDGTGLVLVDGAVAEPVTFKIKIDEFQVSTSAMPLGAARSGSVGPGDQRGFSFTGSVGQQVYYDALATDLDNVTASLRNPSGTLVWSASAASDFGPYTLPEAGTWTIVIDSTRDTSANYVFRVLDVAAQPVLALDTALSGTLNPQASSDYQAHLFRYVTIPGLALYFDATGANTDATWSFYGANDVSLSGFPNVTTDFEATPTLPGSSVLVLSSSTDAAVPYSFTVIPRNHAPVLAPIGNKIINEETLLTFTALATDAEQPNDRLTFSLDAAAPAGAAIDPNSGVFTWTPTELQGSGVYPVTITVTDDGVPSFSDSEQITITVNEVNKPPSFTKGADQTINEDAGPQTAPAWATNLSTGPAGDAGTTLTFLVTNDNNALFSAQPAIASDGTLTYISAPDANGSATVTVSLMDNGGTAFGGDDTSDPQVFTITVLPVNDPPSFTKGANQTVLEDAGAQAVNGWATAISRGPANESAQTVSFQVSNDNNALFSTQPVIAADGTLTYTPASDANGSATVTVTLKDDGGTERGGVDTSAVQNFTITVTAVNDAPSFTKGADQTVLEDAGAQTVAGWATAISAGPANELAQGLTFQVSNDNAALFSAQPAIAANGTLTYTPAADANGSATVTVTLQDDGGVANGGADTSAAQAFTINVTAVNDAPSFTQGANQTVNEDAGAQTVAGWASAIRAGPANESAQALTFQVTNDSAALFSVPPAIAANGTLTYTPAADAYGTATVTVALKDDGGVANGGVDTSATQNFTITVNAVNDAPSFTKGADQTVLEDAGAQTVAGWASAVSAGPANESAQTLTFQVSNDNPALFSSQPAIAANGTLTYTPAANANGSATVTVSLKDSAGTANGGADTSAPQMLVIAVTAVNDPPSFTKGADQTVTQNASAQTVPGWATAISAGPADEAGQTLSFQVNNDNPALFSTQPALSPTGTLTYTPATDKTGAATVTVSLQDSGGTANGGADTSAPQLFTITVNAQAQDIILTPTIVSGTGNFKLSFTGVPGRRHSVQASTNLGNPQGWTTIITFPAGAGAFEYEDTATSNTPLRFFRVVLEQ